MLTRYSVEGDELIYKNKRVVVALTNVISLSTGNYVICRENQSNIKNTIFAKVEDLTEIVQREIEWE